MNVPRVLEQLKQLVALRRHLVELGPHAVEPYAFRTFMRARERARRLADGLEAAGVRVVQIGRSSGLDVRETTSDDRGWLAEAPHTSAAYPSSRRASSVPSSRSDV